MIRLQKFGFRESAYERPQDKWVCGRLAEGHPCSLGPGRFGRCRVTTVCKPALEGDRWECRRSIQDGGSCDEGPLPDGTCCKKLERCVPKRSIRAKRGRVAVWAASVAIALIALINGGSNTDILNMPGAISAPHASMKECRSCHAGMPEGALGWMHTLFTDVGPEANVALCTSCHKVGDEPTSPHTFPVAELRKMTEAQEARPTKDSSWVHFISFPGPKKQPDTGEPQIFCATCHREHQGLSSSLTTVSNARCQTCHVSKFGAFASSHPEFTNFPFHRRTRIIFPHQGHFGKYFADASANAANSGSPLEVPGKCTDCHELGRNQGYMQVKSFATMCQSCHEGDIIGTTRMSGTRGIDFIAVPGIDVSTLEEHGIDVGEWPGRSEAKPTAFMRLLLSSQSGGKDIVAGVDGLDLLDLTDASDADLAKVADLAWSVKRLFYRLQTDSLTKTMAMPGEHDMSPMAMTMLTGMISHDVILAANEQWFPDLRVEMWQHDQGQPTDYFKKMEAEKAKKQAEEEAKKAAEAAAAAAAAAKPAGGADAGGDILSGGGDQGDVGGGLLSDGSSDQGNVGGGLLSDGGGDKGDVGGGLLSDSGGDQGDIGGGLLSDGGSDQGGDAGGGLLSDGGGDQGGDVGGGLLSDGGSDQGGDVGGGLLSDGGGDQGGDAGGGLLSDGSGDQGDVGGGILSDGSGDQGGDVGGGLLSDGGDQGNVGGGMLEPGGGTAAADSGEASSGTQQQAEAPPPPPEFDPEQWAQFGGWYRQDYTIRYRPYGHADRFLRVWLEFAGNAYGTNEQAVMSPVFDQLSPDAAVGRCMKCHSIDDEADGTKNIKWHPFEADDIKVHFTKFSHEPHISSVGDEGCVGCHQMKAAEGDYLKTYAGFDPSVFDSNFKQINKSVCANCHTPQVAGDTCTLCHDYHPIDLPPPVVQTQIGSRPKEDEGAAQSTTGG